MAMVVHDMRNPTVSTKLSIQLSLTELRKVTHILMSQNAFKEEFTKATDRNFAIRIESNNALSAAFKKAERMNTLITRVDK